MQKEPFKKVASKTTPLEEFLPTPGNQFHRITSKLYQFLQTCIYIMLDTGILIHVFSYCQNPFCLCQSSCVNVTIMLVKYRYIMFALCIALINASAKSYEV